MAANIFEITAHDVTLDLLNVIDGHVSEDYFADHSSVSYDATIEVGTRPHTFDVIAEDSDGIKRLFKVTVLDAGIV